MVGGKGGGGVRGFFGVPRGILGGSVFCWVGGFWGGGEGKVFFGWVFLWDCTFVGRGTFFGS